MELIVDLKDKTYPIIIERGIINMLSKFNLFNVNLVQDILFELFVK